MRKQTDLDHGPRGTVEALALNVVAGGAGFIGSHLCRALLDRGEAVLCLDNLQTARPSNLRTLEGQPHFRFLHHDISQPLPAELLRMAPRIHRVWNLACPASPPQRCASSAESPTTSPAAPPTSPTGRTSSCTGWRSTMSQSCGSAWSQWG